MLLNYEETRERKKLNARKIAKDPEASLIATSQRNKEIFSRADYELEKENSDSDGHESKTERIKVEMAFLAQRLEKKKFGGYKGKSTFNPKKA